MAIMEGFQAPEFEPFLCLQVVAVVMGSEPDGFVSPACCLQFLRFDPGEEADHTADQG